MGYREYAKDYEIEYVDIPGKRRPKAVRIYVGPYFQFALSQRQLFRIRMQYLLLILLDCAALLIPMAVDSRFTRVGYILVPGAAALIPWFLAACSVWRLWTAGERVDREHYELLHNRMRSASFFLMSFAAISTVACGFTLLQETAQPADYGICLCYLVALAAGTAMFSGCKNLEMMQVENPEKPKAGRRPPEETSEDEPLLTEDPH